MSLYNKTQPTEEMFFSLLAFVFISHDPDAAQTVHEMVTNGFILFSQLLIVLAYRKAFVRMFLFFSLSLNLYLSVRSVGLGEPVWYIESCLVPREDLLMPAYKRANNDSSELAEKWKLRTAQKRYLTSKIHLFSCQTFIRK